jgi:TRAP-type mannitol/chloroaromatic compound transport system permease small subunit
MGKDQRRNRLWWAYIGGLCPLGILFLFHPFSRVVFIGYSLTVLSYGDSFYVLRKGKLGERWVWKSVLATIPLHLLFLVGIEGLIRVLPTFARTGLTIVAFVAICFAIESVLFDSIADRFEPHVAQQPS